MQYYALIVATLASLAAAAPAESLEARGKYTFAPGTCTVQVRTSTAYGCWTSLDIKFLDGKGKEAAKQSAPIDKNLSSGMCSLVNDYTIKAGNIPHDLSVKVNRNDKGVPYNVQPLATLTYGDKTFSGNNKDVCTMLVKNNIATGMDCKFTC